MVSRAWIAAVLAWELGGCAPVASAGADSVGSKPSAQRANCRAGDELAPEPPAPPGSLNPRRVEADYQVAPHEEIRPCVFSGTLALELPLFSEEGAAQPFARAEFLEVASVGLATEGSRQELRLAWPLRARVWVSSEAFPFALGRRIELIAERYWLAPGTRVAAWKSARSSTAIVVRPLDPGLRVPGLSAGALRAERPCSVLGFPVEGLFDRALGPNHAMALADFEHWVDLTAGAELHAEAGARPDGVLPAMNGLALVEQRGAWALVRNFSGDPTRGEVDFLGWVKSAVTTPAPKPVVAFGPTWLAATHQAVSEIPVATAPDGAVRVGVIPPGVPFRAVQYARGHVEVHLPGIARGGTWITEAELCMAKRLR